MNTGRSVDTMLLVGGNVVLDFINTVDVRNDGFGPDYLLDYRDLLAFATRTSLLDADDLQRLEQSASKQPREAEGCLLRARTVRELLYGLCRAEFSGEEIAEGDLNEFHKAVLDAMAERVLIATPDGLQYKWRSAKDLNLATHALALAAHELLMDRRIRRSIRECPGRHCGWVFLDTSKGGKRRWCSDKTCGTASRITKFRAIAAN